MKKILNVWNEYLSSPASASVLGSDPEGWFSPHGLASLEEVANKARGTNLKFDEIFHCDPKAEHYGYKSWDDFFTRLLKEDARPVEGKDDESVVNNACESKVYKVAHDVNARDQFWIKGQVSDTICPYGQIAQGGTRGIDADIQPYSVLDMLAFDDYADQFIGGTIYQAFLSALSYHRWHAPVTGTVKKAYVVDGTYFSEPLYEDFAGQSEADPQGECTSQEYISAVATRAIIFIESDNPKIGLMAFIGIGMTEVSTCEITVKEGQHITKGDQLG